MTVMKVFVISELLSNLNELNEGNVEDDDTDPSSGSSSENEDDVSNPKDQSPSDIEPE